MLTLEKIRFRKDMITKGTNCPICHDLVKRNIRQKDLKRKCVVNVHVGDETALNNSTHTTHKRDQSREPRVIWSLLGLMR